MTIPSLSRAHKLIMESQHEQLDVRAGMALILCYLTACTTGCMYMDCYLGTKLSMNKYGDCSSFLSQNKFESQAKVQT